MILWKIFLQEKHNPRFILPHIGHKKIVADIVVSDLDTCKLWALQNNRESDAEPLCYH